DLRHVVRHDAPNAFAVILVAEEAGERIVLWDRDSRLLLAQGEIPADTIRSARILHVDDVDVEAAIAAAGIARAAGVPSTSDIEAVRERTDALVDAVSIPIFAEHVPPALTREQDLERALRAARRRRERAVARRCGGVSEDRASAELIDRLRRRLLFSAQPGDGAIDAVGQLLGRKLILVSHGFLEPEQLRLQRGCQLFLPRLA